MKLLRRERSDEDVERLARTVEASVGRAIAAEGRVSAARRHVADPQPDRSRQTRVGTEAERAFNADMKMSADDELRRTAERRVAAKLGFRAHLFIYVIVNGGLLLLNLVTSPDYLWCLWPIAGWGIGLAAHGFAVYGSGDVDRERMVEAELERLRRGRRSPP